MRSHRDAKFVVDADWVLNDPNVKLLGTSDLGGLLKLMATAWLDQRCSIPPGDEHLAALSEMGEGDWLGSKIRKHLGLFFRPLSDGRLQCIVLAEDRAKEEDIKDKRRRAGRASASARLMRAVSALTPPLTEAPKPTPDVGANLPPLPNRADWLKAGDVTDQQLRDVYDGSGGLCHYCGAEVKDPLYHPRRFRGFDHVVPMCQGGRHTASNIVVSCRSCNCAKGGSERRNTRKVRERNTRATHDERVCLAPEIAVQVPVQQVCIMCCTGVNVETGGGGAPYANLLPETQMGQPAAQATATGPAAVPLPPGKEKCSGNAASRAIAEVCEELAHAPPLPAACAPPVSAQTSPPCIPPIERESFSSSSDEDKSEEESSISGGCAREGAKLPDDVETFLATFSSESVGTDLEREVADGLKAMGFRVVPQFPVPYYQDVDGYIDLLADRGGLTVALEIDVNRPKKKSVGKLLLCRNAVRVVLLRGAEGEQEPPEGIHRVIGLSRKARERVQLDMFDAPHPQGSPKRPTRRRITRAVQEAASRVVDAFQVEVGPSHRRTAQADRNVAWWLVDGYTEADLLGSVKNYAAFCDWAERDPDYRKSALHFFGRKDPVFRSYLKETQHGTQAAPQCYADELRSGLAEAFARVGVGAR